VDPCRGVLTVVKKHVSTTGESGKAVKYKYAAYEPELIDNIHTWTVERIQVENPLSPSSHFGIIVRSWK
jgi:hypothetical protein